MPAHCRFIRQSTKDGENFDDGRSCAFNHGETSALAVSVVSVDTSADQQLTFISLTDVSVDSVRHDNRMQNRLHRLGDQGLQRMALHRQANSSQLVPAH